MASYVDLATFNHALGFESQYHDADCLRALEAASRCVEELTEIDTFTKDSVDTSRTYYPRGTLVLLHETVSVTEVATSSSRGGTFTPTTEYDLVHPKKPSRPYTMMRLDSGPYVREVRVTGIHGWPEVPPQVNEFVILVASRFVKRKETPFGIYTDTVDGQIARIAREDPDAQMLVDRLKRYAVAVA